MKFSEPELADLRAMRDICKRPLRCSGTPLGHEDVPRTPDGLPIVSITDFLPECSRSQQHFACPHFLTHNNSESAVSHIQDVLLLLKTKKFKSGIGDVLSVLAFAGAKATRLDNLMRKARTNSYDTEHLRRTKIPDAITAEKNATWVAEEFEEFCRSMEPLRDRILTLIEEALSESQQ